MRFDVILHYRPDGGFSAADSTVHLAINPSDGAVDVLRRAGHVVAEVQIELPDEQVADAFTSPTIDGRILVVAPDFDGGVVFREPDGWDTAAELTGAKARTLRDFASYDKTVLVGVNLPREDDGVVCSASIYDTTHPLTALSFDWIFDAKTAEVLKRPVQS